MKLQKGTLLYHGSYAQIECIELSKCNRKKDFGRGFYVTSSIEQAISFIPNACKKAGLNQKFGYVSVFAVSEDIEVPVYEFKNADAKWLYYIATNRRDTLAETLKENIPQELLNAEIIKGKIANDTTNPTLTAFLSGLYGPITEKSSVDIAVSLLLPDRLKDQICFKSQRAVDCLKFVESKRYEY